jgi:hypothetical protein
MLRSDDPLPQNVIRFSEGFERFFRATEPRSQELEAAANDAFTAFEKGGFPQALQHEWHAALDALERARFAAWGQWRSSLAGGRFVACIRDPDNNVILELDKGWASSQGLGPYCFIDDFVCPDDPIVPGPLGAIGGKLRPVFFVESAFEAALAAVSGPVPDGGRKRSGRRPMYDREQITRIVFEQMNLHGEFYPSDPEWRAQADLERAVMERLGSNPAESTVRGLIKKPLEAWRRKKHLDCPPSHATVNDDRRSNDE